MHDAYIVKLQRILGYYTPPYPPPGMSIRKYAVMKRI